MATTTTKIFRTTKEEPINLNRVVVVVVVVVAVEGIITIIKIGDKRIRVTIIGLTEGVAVAILTGMRIIIGTIAMTGHPSKATKTEMATTEGPMIHPLQEAFMIWKKPSILQTPTPISIAKSP
jgi:hypothetical protein